MTFRVAITACFGLVAALVGACGGAGVEPDGGTSFDVANGVDARVDGASNDAAVGCDGACARSDGRVVRGPFATRVVSFEPGGGAGFGASAMPDIVLGPPVGGGDFSGSTDVVSLGRGGRLCVAFDDIAIEDGPGVDFVVFENAFNAAGTRTVFFELGEVSVSDDGMEFLTFRCVPGPAPPFQGCAGWNPVYSRPDNTLSANDPAVSGGDGFDLADVGLARARVVCIRDLATQAPAPPSTGFDLDAIAVVNPRVR